MLIDLGCSRYGLTKSVAAVASAELAPPEALVPAAALESPPEPQADKRKYAACEQRDESEWAAHEVSLFYGTAPADVTGDTVCCEVLSIM